MDDAPIDVHFAKLPDWLVKRRICKQNWMERALHVREMINQAIQDMPANEEIQQLLTGTYINYFHCTRIVEILKETEADTKNIFGRYSSQRMKDWQAVLREYEVDNTYLAEAAQMLYRNVNFEIPALKKQLSKCNKMKQDCLRKEADYKAMAQDLRAKFLETCRSYGIQGSNVKQELLQLSSGLATSLDEVGRKCLRLQPAIIFYDNFMKFKNKGDGTSARCELLSVLAKSGNITCYEWKTGMTPPSQSLTGPTSDAPAGPSSPETPADDWDTIDFGDVDLDDDADAISYDIQLDSTIEVTESGQCELMAAAEEDIKSCPATDSESAISAVDLLTLLENPSTRFHILDDLEELLVFLEQIVYETKSTAGMDVVTMTITQSMTSAIQLSEHELQEMVDVSKDVTRELLSPKLQQLLSISNSPRFLDRLTQKVEVIKSEADKMDASARLMSLRFGEADVEIGQVYPKIDLIKVKTRQLKAQVEKVVSKKCNDRQFNIIGEINTL